MENGSGQGKGSSVPTEIERWNWGAFLLHWVWGVGNNTLVALLALLPCAIFVMPIVLGLNGSKWAWQNKRWESVEQFQSVQRKWAQAGLALVAFGVVALVAVFFTIMATMKSSEAYQIAFARLQAHPETVQVLGQPLETGLVMGQFSATGSTGSAKFSFSVEGSKAEGKAYVDATKDMGIWTIGRLEVEVENRPPRIIVVGPSSAAAP